MHTKISFNVSTGHRSNLKWNKIWSNVCWFVASFCQKHIKNSTGSLSLTPTPPAYFGFAREVWYIDRGSCNLSPLVGLQQTFISKLCLGHFNPRTFWPYKILTHFDPPAHFDPSAIRSLRIFTPGYFKILSVKCLWWNSPMDVVFSGVETF